MQTGQRKQMLRRLRRWVSNEKEEKSFSVKPVFLFAVAGFLILGSTVGSTRAALTYYSENYAVQAEVSKIGVSL